MADLAAQLADAVYASGAAAVRALLAAGADPNSLDPAHGWSVLDIACMRGDPPSVEGLLEAGADPGASVDGWPPLFTAVSHGDEACAALLLAAGADPAHTHDGMAALHCAATLEHPGLIRLLLQAAPHVAHATNSGAATPLMLALAAHRYDAARCLLEQQPAPLPAAYVLRVLGRQLRRREQGKIVRPVPMDLYGILAARQPLSPDQWVRVPAPCPGLAAALPAVLRRSETEAALLVQHLPQAERHRLRTAALCLARVQRSSGTVLPADILRPLLLAAVVSDT